VVQEPTSQHAYQCCTAWHRSHITVELTRYQPCTAWYRYHNNSATY
jgi:hypothetical protein